MVLQKADTRGRRREVRFTRPLQAAAAPGKMGNVHTLATQSRWRHKYRGHWFSPPPSVPPMGIEPLSVQRPPTTSNKGRHHRGGRKHWSRQAVAALGTLAEDDAPQEGQCQLQRGSPPKGAKGREQAESTPPKILPEVPERPLPASHQRRHETKKSGRKKFIDRHVNRPRDEPTGIQ